MSCSRTSVPKARVSLRKRRKTTRIVKLPFRESAPDAGTARRAPRPGPRTERVQRLREALAGTRVARQERMSRALPRALAVFAAVAVAGCAGSRTGPPGMTWIEHRTAAERAEQTARRHAARYDPGAVREVRRCAKPNVCWTSRANPSRQHLSKAARYRRLAAEHRRASAALLEAERRACARAEQRGRDIDPFRQPDEIVAVERVHEAVERRGRRELRLRGSRIVFRRAPGVTAERLGLEVECQLARAATLPESAREEVDSPLALAGVNALVAPAAEGVALEVTSADSETAREIQRRAEALVRPGRSPLRKFK